MEQFERSLEHYSHVKQELIKTAQKLNSSDSEEKGCNEGLPFGIVKS